MWVQRWAAWSLHKRVGIIVWWAWYCLWEHELAARVTALTHYGTVLPPAPSVLCGLHSGFEFCPT
jgi:hypothetical protein